MSRASIIHNTLEVEILPIGVSVHFFLRRVIDPVVLFDARMHE